ncbi:MAG: hypothetical protein HQK49_17455 [Oligoflexia bacterium]|nr:hypothetical protein [Oligoflexia bacterium]
MNKISKLKIKLKIILKIIITTTTIFSLYFSITNLHATLMAEGFGGISYGNQLFEEYYNETQFKHEGITWGPEYGGRLGLKIYYVMFGVMETKLSSQISGYKSPGANLEDGSSKYKMTLEEALWGPYIAIYIPKYFVRIISEYYYEAKGRFVTVTEDEADCAPFYQYDKVFGNGWSLGAGVMYRFFTATIMYRELTYNRGIFAGNSGPLPGEGYPATYRHKTTSLQLGLFLNI